MTRPIVNPNDPTRTSTGELSEEPPVAMRVRDDRLPAPLQVRDPARYQVIAEHGRGGLGRVMRARDKELGRDVAVKELLERTSSHELRFFREALITSRLEHPGIVPVHEAGRWPDGTPFYAMKLVHGRPLKALIEECTTQQQRLALLPHLVAVGDAIAYAHDRGIIHRDLKPANVIVGDFGETVVIDWGLAKDLRRQDPESNDGDRPDELHENNGVTRTGTVLGTPAYMAPEQHAGAADIRTDVYALGGILFHLVHGVAPHATAEIPASVRVPRDLKAILSKAMATKPAHRYPSATELTADLKRYLRRDRVTARKYSLFSKIVLRLSRNRVAAMTLVGSLAAITLILTAAVILLGLLRSAERESSELAESRYVEARLAQNELLLEHAEAELERDPTRAIELLTEYNGHDHGRRDRIRAAALAHGVARVRVAAHHGAVRFLAEDRTGRIISVGEDGKVVATSIAGEVAILANDARIDVAAAYDASSNRMAYATDSGLAILDLWTSSKRLIREPLRVGGVLFQRGGRRLTALVGGEIAQWDFIGTDLLELPRESSRYNELVLLPGDRIGGVNLGFSELTMDVRAASREQVAMYTVPRARAYTAHDDGIATLGVDGNAEFHTAYESKRWPSDGPRLAQIVRVSGSLVLAIEEGRSARVVHAATGNPVDSTVFQEATGIVAASADGQLLGVADRVGVVNIRDLRRSVSHRLRTNVQVTAVLALERHGRSFATGSVDGTIRLWRPIDTSERRLDVPSLGVPVSVAFDGDNDILVGSSDGRTFSLALRADRSALNERPSFGPAPAYSHITGDDERTVAVHHDGKIRVWRDGSEIEDPRAQIPFDLRLARTAPSGRRMLALGARQVLVRLDADGSYSVDSADLAGARATALDVDRDADIAAIGTDAGRVILRELVPDLQREPIRASTSIIDVALSEDGLVLAAVSADGTMHLRAQSDPLHGFVRETALDAVGVCVSRAGRWVGVPTRRDLVWLYSLPHRRWSAARHVGGASRCAFSPDEQLLATAGDSGSIVIHELVEPTPPDQLVSVDHADDQEPRDEAWAASVEQAMTDTIGPLLSEGFHAARLQSVNCWTRRCTIRFAVAHEDEADFRQFAGFTLPLAPGTRQDTEVVLPDGSVEVSYLLFLDGIGDGDDWLSWHRFARAAGFDMNLAKWRLLRATGYRASPD